ncbi:hypothetical protein L2E82_14508 [Cichorium intybus]|uniref:Uncharacterized protein n=1 Tax=Cichorium intybus TaxID=13427 RepID=A0ACB9EZM7_CICIN|nr:hypothetical protein L2E82_14508 [Cichorium intybus]
MSSRGKRLLHFSAVCNGEKFDGKKLMTGSSKADSRRGTRSKDNASITSDLKKGEEIDEITVEEEYEDRILCAVSQSTNGDPTLKVFLKRDRERMGKTVVVTWFLVMAAVGFTIRKEKETSERVSGGGAGCSAVCDNGDKRSRGWVERLQAVFTIEKKGKKEITYHAIDHTQILRSDRYFQSPIAQKVQPHPMAPVVHLTLIAVFITGAAAYTNHTVGGPAGWFFDPSTNTSSANYASWAGNQTFGLGDYLNIRAPLFKKKSSFFLICPNNHASSASSFFTPPNSENLRICSPTRCSGSFSAGDAAGSVPSPPATSSAPSASPVAVADMGEKKDKISWKYEGVEKTFLEACLHEVTANGREGSSLKSLSWKNVAEKLKNEHNFIVDQKQMKNHYDYLKSKFSAFLKLKNKTGNYYNPSTNTFNLTKEEWELESKSNKNIESLRRTPLPFPDLCTQLFEGATSTGADSWGPSSTLPRPSQDSTQYSLNDFDDIDCTQKESVGVGEESSGQSKKRKRREMSKSKETSNSRLLEIGEDISKVAKILVETNTNQTVVLTYNETTFRSCSVDNSSDSDTFLYGQGNQQFGQPLTVAVPLTIEGPNYFFSDASDGIQCANGMAFGINVSHGVGLPPNLNQPPPPPYVEPPSNADGSLTPPGTIPGNLPSGAGWSVDANVRRAVYYALTFCGIFGLLQV